MHNLFTVLLCLYYLFRPAMSFLLSRQNNLQKISCRIFRGGQCLCSPTLFCAPVSSKNYQANDMQRTLAAQTRMYSGTRLSAHSDTNTSQEKVTNNDGSVKSKLTYMWKTYGVVAVGTYLGIYVGTLSSVFFALDMDIFNAATFGVDPVKAVEKVNS